MAAFLMGKATPQAFQHRSARLIALSRMVLAAFFALAVWLDPTPSAETSDITFLLLIVYTVFAGVILCVTWASWWLETRLAALAHMVDLVVFTMLIFLTEGYVSPFFTFFVFLVLSASIRVGWREALFTTALVLLLFFAASIVAAKTIAPPDFQLQRFMVRGANLVVLSLMIVWFGVNQPALRGRVASDPLDDLPAVPEPPVAEVMTYAAGALGAGRVVFAWSEAEEPWLNIWSLEANSLTKEKLGPEEFPEFIDAAIASRPFLFDSRRRAMSGNGERHWTTGGAIAKPFRDRFAIDTGLGIPVRGIRYDGELFVLDVPGLSADDLRIAGSVGKQVGAMLDRSALFEATEQGAAARTRMVLARDLHDSVVQAFAGISLKLQGLRNSGLDDRVDDEMKQLLAQLAQEQRDLRGMIAKLRDPNRLLDDDRPLPDILSALVKRLEQQWRIRCTLTIDPQVETGAVPHHDIDQLIREAVANAVRHGHAGAVEVAAAANDGALRLSIADDGQGFPVSGEFDDHELGERQLGPSSLHERVHSLGGTMRLATRTGEGSTLTIVLPSAEASA